MSLAPALVPAFSGATGAVPVAAAAVVAVEGARCGNKADARGVRILPMRGQPAGSADQRGIGETVASSSSAAAAASTSPSSSPSAPPSCSPLAPPVSF